MWSLLLTLLGPGERKRRAGTVIHNDEFKEEVYVIAEFLIFFFTDCFCFCFCKGMHKKSTETVRKPGSDDRLTGLWDPDHLQEALSRRPAGLERGSCRESPEHGLEDRAIDLSSSARQESKKVLPRAGAQGCSDVMELDRPQPGKAGAS